MTGVTWDLVNNDGKYTLTKTGDDAFVFDKVDLPSPQKEYSIETNSDGVSFLKDGDELLKSCDETMNEILQSDSVKTGPMPKFLKSQIQKK